MLAFGSCNRQNKPQHHWDVIGGLNPTHFAWIGDAVYSKSVGIPKLQEAYHNLTTNPHYSKFTDHVIVDGVWDDHDYGINDAGRHASHQSERKAEFMKFLSHGSRNTDLRIDHDGLYHIMQVDLNGNMIKLIFLDTRTFRDDHWIRSLGEMSFKGSAIIAASLRAAYSTLGFARQYDGEMLGEPQWKWLEQTLQESKEEGVASNIVVSSVQVLTTNPLFESWGHFPTEKRRLFDLMQKTDPAGLMFLSGDVHLSEISVAKFTRADGNIGEWPEVTSSGLTHTCADGLLGFVCPIVMSLCSHHRRAGKSLYLGKNFGTLETVVTRRQSASRITHNPTPHTTATSSTL